MHVHVIGITGASSHVVSVGGELAAASFHFSAFCAPPSSAAPQASLHLGTRDLGINRGKVPTCV